MRATVAPRSVPPVGDPAPVVVLSELRREFTTPKRLRRAERTAVALEGLNLGIETNEILGLLGPNGAGKTTLVKILSTVLLPTSGKATVFGHDVVDATAAVRERIGIVLGGERGL